MNSSTYRVNIQSIIEAILRRNVDDKSLYEIKIKLSISKRTIVIATMDKKESNYGVKKIIEMINK